MKVFIVSSLLLVFFGCKSQNRVNSNNLESIDIKIEEFLDEMNYNPPYIRIHVYNEENEKIRVDLIEGFLRPPVLERDSKELADEEFYLNNKTKIYLLSYKEDSLIPIFNQQFKVSQESKNFIMSLTPEGGIAYEPKIKSYYCYNYKQNGLNQCKERIVTNGNYVE